MASEQGLKVGILPVTAFQQNCSLIWCARTLKGAFVDAGGEPDRLLAAAQEHGVTIEKLLVTHGHIDHAGAVREISERLGVPVEGPQKEDNFWIEQIAVQGKQFGFPGARSFTPTRWLEDGDTVTVGEQTMDVIYCPGHTPGHVVFYHKGLRLAFVGDVLFQGSIGRTDFERGNHGDLISSIRDKLFPLGDDITFVPGHGPLSTFGRERQSNPYVSDLALGLA